MASVPLDTLRVSRRLRDAGFTEPQAEAVALVIAEQGERAAKELVSHDRLSQEFKAFRAEVKADIEAATNPIKADVLVLKWMMGFVLAGIVTLIARSFSV